MFRYDPAQFAGLPRAAFLEALRRRASPPPAATRRSNKEPFLEDTLASRGYRRIYGERVLRRLARAQPLPAERSAVRGSGVARPDDAARAAGATWTRSPRRRARCRPTRRGWSRPDARSGMRRDGHRRGRGEPRGRQRARTATTTVREEAWWRACTTPASPTPTTPTTASAPPATAASSTSSAPRSTTWPRRCSCSTRRWAARDTWPTWTRRPGRRAAAPSRRARATSTSSRSGGRLYFATHIGFYSNVDGMETMGIPPAGFSRYPGGHLLTYDLATGRIEDLALAPEQEGVLTMNVDGRRGRVYGLTWPTGYFFRHDVASRETKTLGRFFEKGENGKGAEYRTICRSLAVDPEDGSVYFTRGEGTILRYRYDRDAVEPVRGDDLAKDYFGHYEAASAGPHGLQLAADRLPRGGPPLLRRARQLRIPVLVRSPRRARRGPRPHHVRALAPERHVRPVQLRVPRLHAGSGRPHAALPDRRSHLRRAAGA